jgi:hypothetical protein
MTDWQLIPEEIDRTKAPFDGEDYLLYADSATVDVVRLGWWNPGGIVDYSTGEIYEPAPDDLGWWSYRHSVTSEQLGFLKFTHWAPFERPS